MKQSFRSHSLRFFRSAAIIGALAACAPVPATFGATVTWNGTDTGNNWNNTGNWSPAQLPTNSDSAIIDNGKTALVDSTTGGAVSKVLYVGNNGTGALFLSGGGTVTTAQDIYIGNNAGSSGTVTVDGAGSVLKNTVNDLSVGYSGNGVLNITNGGQAIAAGSVSDVNIGFLGGTGTINVNGTGSLLQSGSWFNIGYFGSGTLNITNGGAAVAASDVYIGIANFNGSKGAVFVGSGSTLTSTTGGIYVGGNNQGIGGPAILSGTGTVTATGGTGTIQVWSTGTLSAGDTAGAIGTLNLVGNLTLMAGSSLQIDYNATSIDRIAVTGNITLNGAPQLRLSNLAGGNITTALTILSATGTITNLGSTNTTFLLNGLSLAGSRAANSGVTLQTTGSDLQITSLTIDPAAASKNVTWSNSVASANWDIASRNWTDNNGGAVTTFLDGDAITFATTGNTTVNILGTQKTVSQMTVNNAGGNLTINGNITGDASSVLGSAITSDGSFTKRGAGALTLNGTGTFGGNITLDGGSTAIGASSALATAGILYVGNNDTGALKITTGGTVQSALDIFLGYLSGGNGTVTVDGSGSALRFTNAIVGDLGTGALNLTAGGSAQATSAVTLGAQVGSTGTAGVDGTGSVLGSEGDLNVGAAGTGTLAITRGGKAQSGSGDVRIGAGSGTGTGTVNGAGSVLGSGRYLYVGNVGAGTLTLSNGGAASGVNDIFIGYGSGSTGIVTVGTGSTLTSTGGNIYVGGNTGGAGGNGLLAGTGTVTANNGTGTITVYNTGTLSAGDAPNTIGTLRLNGNLVMLAGSTLRVDLGAGNTSDLIAVNGTANIDTPHIDLATLGSNGTYTLVNSTGALTAANLGAATFTLNGEAIATGSGSRISSFASAVTGDANNLYLNISTVGANNLVSTWTGAINAAWDIANANWTNSANNQFLDGDSVIFNGTGGIITVSGTGKTIADMTITGGTWTFNAGGIEARTDASIGITPAGTLTVSGADTSVTFNNANEFSNGIFLSGGSIILGNDKALGTYKVATGQVQVTGNGTIGTTDNRTISNRFNVTDGTALALTVAAGKTLTISGVNATGNGGAITLNNSGQLNQTGNLVFSGNSSTGNGGAIFSNGAVTLGNNAAFTGNTASGQGGAIISNNNSVTLGQNTYFTANWSQATGVGGGSAGGAINVDRNLSIAGNTYFQGNLAANNGGAAFMWGSGGAASATLDTTAGNIAFSGNMSNVTFTAGTSPRGYTATGGAANSLHLNGNVSVVINGNNNVYFDDPLSSGTGIGNNSFAKNGTGFVQFAGSTVLNPNLNGGAVNLNAGTFRVVTGATFTAQGNTAAFTAAAGTTLAGGGSITATQGFVINGTIAPDNDRFVIPTFDTTGNTFSNDKPTAVDPAKNIGTLKLTGATAFNNATFAVDINNAATQKADLVNVTGAVTLAGTNTVVLTGAAATGAAYNIVQSNTAMSDPAGLFNPVNLANLSVNGYSGTRATAAVQRTGNNLQVKIGSTLANTTLYWNNNAGIATWSTADTDRNWMNISGAPGTENRFLAGDIVVFNDTAGTPQTVAIAAAGVTAASVTVNNAAGNYTFTGGSINGTGALTKSGTGTLTLSNANAYVGGTNVNAGTLALTTNGSSTGAIGTGALNIAANATVTIAPAAPGAYTFANGLTGTGTLAVNLGNNANAISFTPAAGNAFSGTIKIQNAAFNTGTQANATVAQNATLTLGAGSITDVAATTYTGNLSLESGAILTFHKGQVLNTGVLNFQSGIRLNFADYLSDGTTYTLINFTGTQSGAIAAFTIDNGALAGYSLAIQDTNLVYTVIPEPGTYGVIAAGVGLLLAAASRRRRKRLKN